MNCVRLSVPMKKHRPIRLVVSVVPAAICSIASVVVKASLPQMLARHLLKVTWMCLSVCLTFTQLRAQPYAWGLNNFGQAGNNSTASQWTPGAVNVGGVLNGKTIQAMASGEDHTLAVCTDGSVVSWGWNWFGQLGDGSTTQSLVPIAVDGSAWSSAGPVVAVSAGIFHSVALAANGTVYTWGLNSSGQLGNGSTAPHFSPQPVDTSGALAGKTVKTISAGYSCVLALCTDGTLVAWGDNNAGQLGNNSTTQSAVPVQVDASGVLAGKTVTAIGAGHNHCLALCSDGTLVAWGSGSSGQLGNGSTASSPVPVLVSSVGVLAGKTVNAIAAGDSFNLALCSDGTLVSWGYNFYGQLGNNGTAQSAVPVLVDTSGVLAGKTVAQISAGSAHAMVVCSDGTVATWGRNGEGQLGDGTSAQHNAPVLPNLAALNGAAFNAVFSGPASFHSLGLVNPPPCDPQIAIRSDTSVFINNGDNTPTGNDHTDFFEASLCGPSVTYTYSIYNYGHCPLTVTNIVSSNPAGFSVSAPAFPIVVPGNGSWVNFAVTFHPTSAGTQTAVLSLFNDDPTAAPFTYTIQGSGMASGLGVLGGIPPVVITNGATTATANDGTDFLDVMLCPGSVTHTFTIFNSGTCPLTVTDILSSNPSEFLVGSPSFPLVIPPGASGPEFTVTFDPSASGSRTGTITLVSGGGTGNQSTFSVAGNGVCSFFASTFMSDTNVIAGPIYNPANGHVYYLLNESTWTASEAEAVALGGHLATVRSQAENDWIYAQFSQFGGINRGLWIGLNDAAQEGAFVWASGEPVSYLNWAQLEPRNQDGLDDYVHLFWPNDTAGRSSYWNDQWNIIGSDFGIPPINGVVELTSISPASTNVTVHCGPWDFDAPVLVNVCTGTNSNPVVLSTVTNQVDPLIVTRTWSAVDSCGGTNLFSRTVTVDCSTNGCVPGIEVKGEGRSLVNGAANPTESDGTGFLDVSVCAGSNTHTFTIYNTNACPLTVTNILSSNPFEFAVGALNLPLVIPGGGAWASFTVTFTPSGLGSQTSVITIGNDDPTANPYQFTVGGNGVGPSVEVSGGTTPIPILDGDLVPMPADGTDFGAVTLNSSTSAYVFTITNTGTSPVSLAGTPVVAIGGANPGDFVVTQPGVTALGVGDSTTFTVVFQPTAVGLRAALLNILLDRCKLNPYDFAIQGEGMEVPTTLEIDCGEDRTIEQGKVWGFDHPVVIDTCGGASVMVLTTVTNGICPMVVTRTWVVTNACGQSATCSQTITLRDTIPPVMVCPKDKIVVAMNRDCQFVIPLIQPPATDNSTPSSDLVYSQTPAAGTPVSGPCELVTVVVRDRCDNLTRCQVVVCGEDRRPPKVIVPDVVRTADCLVPDVTGLITARDNCTAFAQLVITQSPAPGTPIALGGNLITVTVTDQAGNSTTEVMTLTLAGGGQSFLGQLFNTGVDASKAVVAGGSVDMHYGLGPVAAGTPTGAGGYNAPDAIVVTGLWGLPPFTFSRWISPSVNAHPFPLGSFTYTNEFVLPAGVDPATASITGRWAADDGGAIYFNGLSAGNRVSAITVLPPASYTQWTPFTVGSGFLANPAVNRLYFVVTNSETYFGYSGLRVEFSSAAANCNTCAPPVILLQSPDQSRPTGSVAGFSVTAWGTPSLTYQWYRNGVALLNGGHYSGVNTANLTIGPLGFGDAGIYQVVVSNGCGEVRGHERKLKVKKGWPWWWVWWNVEVLDRPLTATLGHDLVLTSTNLANVSSGTTVDFGLPNLGGRPVNVLHVPSLPRDAYVKFPVSGSAMGDAASNATLILDAYVPEGGRERTTLLSIFDRWGNLMVSVVPGAMGDELRVDGMLNGVEVHFGAGAVSGGDQPLRGAWNRFALVIANEADPMMPARAVLSLYTNGRLVGREAYNAGDTGIVLGPDGVVALGSSPDGSEGELYLAGCQFHAVAMTPEVLAGIGSAEDGPMVAGDLAVVDAPPMLRIANVEGGGGAMGGGFVELSWDGSGFVLEESSDLTNANWKESDVPFEESGGGAAGGDVVVTRARLNPAGQGAPRFFRLIGKP